MTHFNRLFRQLVAFATWAGLVLGAAASVELLPNGSMEQLDSKGWPVGWPAGRRARIEEDTDGRRLVLEGAGAAVNFRIPLEPDVAHIRLRAEMKVTDVQQGRESWQTGRLAMSFHDRNGERIGPWPNVYGFVGTTEWIQCDREYSVPEGAAWLYLSPCNLGESGRVEFRRLSLTVIRRRSMTRSDASLPEGFQGDPWSMDTAWRQTTQTRERICLNGLWAFRFVLTNETPDRVPPPGDLWGWFKVPGMWPTSVGDLEQSPQVVYWAPWLGDRLDLVSFEQAWYRRRIAVPPSWRGRRVSLEFTMLQTHARVYVDGRWAGELWYPGGTVELTSQVEPGREHELAILVTARPLALTHQMFMAPDRVMAEKATVRLRGITGDVFLDSEPTGPRVTGVDVATSIPERRVAFTIETAQLGTNPVQLHIRTRHVRTGEPREFESGPLRAEPDGRLRFEVVWPEVREWDPGSPMNLYDIQVSLRTLQGKVLDEFLPVRVGLREIHIVGREFVLNGIPVRLRALHNTTANSRADRADLWAARETCRRMLAYGFNALITGHYDFAPGSVGYLDALLDACDEAGVLVCFSLPHIKDFASKLDDPAVAELYRRRTAWLIRRVRHHPSVILYAMNHNSTGYYGDQNPLKIDGLYELPEDDETARKVWSVRNRRQARIAEQIARELDPSRPVYHHQSGHLGAVHTVNCYLNWAPIQERSDWTEHWATRGVKPLFFVEWGLPYISSWSSYRGPKFIWRTEAFQSLWAAEFAAQFLGDEAFSDAPAAIRALDHEESLWARGKPFHWGVLNQPLRELESHYTGIQALYVQDNWRSHRMRGVSGMLPWDQDVFWRRVADTAVIEVSNRFEGIQQPGIVPDRRFPDRQFIYDPGSRTAFEPTPVGCAFLRWNMPDCGYIGGPSKDPTCKDHLFRPGESVEKSLVVINDQRFDRTVAWAWEWCHAGQTIARSNGQVRVAAAGCAFVPVQVCVPSDAPNGSRWNLTARFEFQQGVVQTDQMTLLVVEAPRNVNLNRPVRLYDPSGSTAREFRRLGIDFSPWDGARPPRDNEVVVIGRQAIAPTGVPWMAELRRGGRVLVLEQDSVVLERLLGFRVTERGSRQLFLRYAHEVTRGWTDEYLRDWSGEATLLPPYLLDLPHVELHDPHKVWCGFTNTCVWRCRNRGNVASVLIEKPARGDWRAIVDGEFNLQYSALLETVVGRGRVIFCQLDVTGRTRPDPVADQVIVRCLEYLSRAPTPSFRPLLVEPTNGPCASLLRDLGFRAQPLDVGGLPPEAIVVVGPGAKVLEALRDSISTGMVVVAMGLSSNELARLCPKSLTVQAPAAVAFRRIPSPPPELAGLCNADWYWHGRMHLPALAMPNGPEHDRCNPAFRVLHHGRGRLIVWQAPPWVMDVVQRPYLRPSQRRAFAMASRLLANLGAAADSPLPERFARPVDRAWLQSYYLDEPVADDDPYRYYRW